MSDETPAAAAAPKATLYDLELARRQLNAWAQEEAAENDGELPAWLDMLQLDNEDAIEEKLWRIRTFIASVQREIGAIEGEEEVVKAEVKRLERRRTTRENRIKRLKDYVVVCLGAAGLKKVSTPIGDISRQPNGGKRALKVTAGPQTFDAYCGEGRFTKVIPAQTVVDEEKIRAEMAELHTDRITVVMDDGADEPIEVTLAELAPQGEQVRFR